MAMGSLLMLLNLTMLITSATVTSVQSIMIYREVKKNGK